MFRLLSCLSLIGLSALPPAGGVALLALGVSSARAQAPSHDLMPVPAKLSLGTGRLQVSAAFRVGIAGWDDARLRAALARALRRWEERTGFTWARHADATYVLADPPASGDFVIECVGAGPAGPALGEDESYTLTITGQQALLRAATVTGALRGLETMLQLLRADADGWHLPAIEIADAPRFPWRGLLLDPVRHWLPVEVVKRTLDAMAVVKLNVLHLHLTDDQGIRIECRRHPRLHEFASDGQYYTHDQIREIVAYAAARGIRVVPEFDVPGHATSWAVAFPELASGPGPYELQRNTGVADPVLDPTNEKTYELLDDFFGEMAGLFPDAYVHIGGDENNGRQWNANTRIQAFIKEHQLENNAGLHAYFNRRVRDILARHGRKLVGWDEIQHPDLPQDGVVQSWRGPQGVASAARAGWPVLLSHGYYLDHALPARQYYANEPAPAGSLSAAEERCVVGGEACMWGEWVSPETIDSRIWPIAAAIAERLWSPREVNDVRDMYRRLAVVSRRLEEAGALHLKNPPAMLRRLTGGTISAAHFEAVRKLLGLTEAVGLMARKRVHQNYTLFVPLTQLADCAVPDSVSARGLSDAVEDFLFAQNVEDPTARARLVEIFAEWEALARSATTSLAQSPGLGGLSLAAGALTDAARIGAEALEAIASRERVSEEWTRECCDILDRQAEPNSAAIAFPFLQPVRLLVAAASIGPRRARLSSAEWRGEIDKRATAAPGSNPRLRH